MPSGFGKQYLPNANVFCIQYGAESQSDSESWSHPGHDERKGKMQVCVPCDMSDGEIMWVGRKQINRRKDKVKFYLHIYPHGAALEQCSMSLCDGPACRLLCFCIV